MPKSRNKATSEQTSKNKRKINIVSWIAVAATLIAPVISFMLPITIKGVYYKGDGIRIEHLEPINERHLEKKENPEGGYQYTLNSYELRHELDFSGPPRILLGVVLSGYDRGPNDSVCIKSFRIIKNKQSKISEYRDWPDITNPNDWKTRPSIIRVKDTLKARFGLKEKETGRLFKLKLVEVELPELIKPGEELELHIMYADTLSKTFDEKVLNIRVK